MLKVPLIHVLHNRYTDEAAYETFITRLHENCFKFGARKLEPVLTELLVLTGPPVLSPVTATGP